MVVEMSGVYADSAGGALGAGRVSVIVDTQHRYRRVPALHCPDEALCALDVYARDEGGGCLVMYADAVTLAWAACHPLFGDWVRLVTSGYPIGPEGLAGAMLGRRVRVRVVEHDQLEPATPWAQRQYEGAWACAHRAWYSPS